MKAECQDWHTRHLGIQGERVYLINSGGTTIPPCPATPYRLIKRGMDSFLQWLPGMQPYLMERLSHVHPLGRLGLLTWREFVEGLQSYMLRTWWPQYLRLDSLPTREDVGHLAKQLMPVGWRPWTRRRKAFLILLRGQPHVPLVVFFQRRTNIFKRIVLFL